MVTQQELVKEFYINNPNREIEHKEAVDWLTEEYKICSQHNFFKKNYRQTETGKRMFIRLYEASKNLGDEKIARFCEDVLKVYQKHQINDHIEWHK